MREETQIERGEKKGLRWKQTLTFNGLYWSKTGRGSEHSRQWRERERAKEEGRGGLSRGRERVEGGTEGVRGRWCVGKTKTITHCSYIPGVKSWNMMVS